MANNKKYQTSSRHSAELKNTIDPLERLDPLHAPWYRKKLINEHITRYTFAAEYCHGKNVVEIGCGTGYGTSLLVKKSVKKITAIDVDPDSIQYAKQHYAHNKVRFIHASAETTTLLDKFADVVISFETIEHVKNSRKMIQEIQRILKPNGIFILSTPNKIYSYGDNPYHIKEYTLGELNIVLQNFPNKKYYGQGKIIVEILNVYLWLYKKFKNKFIRQFLRLRPWEGFSIYPVKDISETPFNYLIAVCQQENSQK